VKLHEFQAKALFRSAGIPVPEGSTASTVNATVDAASRLGYPVAIKAQVHAGGRGKAGGIKVAQTPAEAQEAAEAILDMQLQTAQTGSQVFTVRKVLVEQGVAIDRELYLSVLPDRASAKVAIIASTEGGMNIEEVAVDTPDKILRIMVDPLSGIQPYHLRQAGFALGLTGESMREFSALLEKLYLLVVGSDLLLAEINPLVLTQEGQFLALDGKVEVDSNALYRQRELSEMHDPGDEDPL
jgi:succinyl-CoA synthetase beta subunit